MAHETVPADIAAAIGRMTQAAFAACNSNVADRAPIARAYDHAKADLEKAIVHLARSRDEMKVALERIEQGA